MATDQSFIEYILDQADLGDRLKARKMFGEYGFHLDGKFVALACDNSLFIKHTRAVEDGGFDFPRRPPYPGAKPYPVADELLDDGPRLQRLFVDTAELLPAPKPKSASRRRGTKE